MLGTLVTCLSSTALYAFLGLWFRPLPGIQWLHLVGLYDAIDEQTRWSMNSSHVWSPLLTSIDTLVGVWGLTYLSGNLVLLE
jgi:hypothetical protein